MSINASKARARYGDELGAYSIEFRRFAAAVDQDPDHIFKHIESDACRALYTLRTLNAERFFRLYEALTYGDIGSLFATPRTCLSGILLQFIGSEAHQEYYFSKMATGQQRCFFATTEVKYGSDASQLETRFDKNKDDGQLSITGEKMLVGNLGFADLGVIIGRTNNGPLGITAALLQPEDFKHNVDNLERGNLPMFGVRAAMLGKASFKGFTIPSSQLIGQQLRATERGLQAVIKTFNIMRLGITGLALGHAQAVIDYIQDVRLHLSSTEANTIALWQQELDATRVLSLDAARYNQTDRIETAHISLAKVRASQLAEKVSVNAIDFLGYQSLHEHPFLVKSLRDCFGYEYMDGTTNIQRKNIYQGFANGKITLT